MTAMFVRPIIADALEYAYLAKKDEIIKLARKHKISKEDAEDLTQDAFLYWWEHLDKLDALVNSRSADDIGAILYNTVYGDVLNLVKSQARQGSRIELEHGGYDGEYGVDDYRYHPEVNLITQEAEMEQDAINDIIDRAIDKLPARQRQAVSLIYRLGSSQREAAEQMGLGYQVFRNLLSQARTALSKKTMPQIEALESSTNPSPTSSWDNETE